MDAAIQLHQDVCLMTTNLDVLDKDLRNHIFMELMIKTVVLALCNAEFKT